MNSLFDLVCLASETGFVDLEIIGLDDEAVGRHNVSIKNLTDVAHENLLHGQLVYLAVSYDANLLIVVDLGLQTAELLLLAPVVERGHQHDDEHGDQYGHALDPLHVGLLGRGKLLVEHNVRVKDERKYQREYGTYDEYDERRVLHRFPHEQHERFGRLRWYFVFAKLSYANLVVGDIVRLQTGGEVGAQFPGEALELSVPIQMLLLLSRLQLDLHHISQLFYFDRESIHFCAVSSSFIYILLECD